MTLRTVTFADLDAGVWGVMWDGPARLAVLGTPAGTAPIPDPELSSAEDEWSLTSGSGLELTISPEGPVAELADGFEQLCRVRGADVDCLGRRSLRSGELELSALDSVRDISAWFAAGEGVVLTALRPRGAKGHGDDEVIATVFEDGTALPVADPRLSTTYTPDGDPRRMSLELWLDDEEAQYPRRFAGTAAAETFRASIDGVELRAEPLRCLRRDQHGAGVYLLVSPR
jgi:hypothetical protein